jgi:hypothetical protein
MAAAESIEQKVIDTETTINVIGSIITITSSYISSGAGIPISAFISDSTQIVNGIAFIEGEGGISYTSQYNGNFSLNNSGELVINADDSSNYSINADGELIYTY